MTSEQLAKTLSVEPDGNNDLFALEISSTVKPEVYPNSINRLNNHYLFIGLEATDKFLFVLSLDGQDSTSAKFEGEVVESDEFEGDISVKRCPLNHRNAVVLRELFDFARPVLVGLQDSMGLGDRLGLANPAHLRAVAGSPMKAVLAQQSIRELERTDRTPDDVMDAAVWAVFQEGYRDGFGADADHLKTTDDIDYMIASGFTMFTFDPGDYVVNEADSLSMADLEDRMTQLPWDELEETLDGCLSRYEGKTIEISDDFTLQPTREDVLRALTKYGNVIVHASKMQNHLVKNYPNYPAELELSVDETESVTSPFEHYLVVKELKRLGTNLVSIAPRFVGGFEKGIDYKGDLELFRREYIKHLQIADVLGPYKISIHSGSDKFSVYNVIGSLRRGHVHVKTAGTSYLEALRTVATTDPDLFREILDYSRELYEGEKKTYHVSAEIENVPPGKRCSDERLMDLFEDDDARQVLHVAFGRILTDTDNSGDYAFKDRLLKVLKENESVHYDYLKAHFRRHLDPFRAPE